MLTIKDFAAGGTAYILNRHHGRNTAPTITEVPVLSVGRQYVTTGTSPYTSRFRNFDREFLLEQVNFGESRLLFLSEQDALDYVEKMDLALWLGYVSTTKAEQYTVEQLRKVKEILSEG